MNTLFNTYMYRAKMGKREYMNNLPQLALNFESKNCSELEEVALKKVLQAAEEDLKNGIVSFRSIRQFRLDPAYKLAMGASGVLPWTAAAADVASAFACMSYLVGGSTGSRVIDRLTKKTAFTGMGTTKTVMICPLDPFASKPTAADVATIQAAIDAINSKIPGTGELLSTNFFNTCSALVDIIINKFNRLDSSQNATTESFVLFKLARSCQLMRNVVTSAKGAYTSLKNCIATANAIPSYIDFSNWSNTVTALWKAMTNEDCTRILRAGATFTDRDLLQDVTKMGNYVIDINTLKPTAYLTIFEKESCVLIDAIDQYNRKVRHLSRLSEVPEYLSQVFAADLLGKRAMTDGEKKLSRVVLLSIDHSGGLSPLFTETKQCTDVELLDGISKKQKRLEDPINCALEVIDTFYAPAMYESWSGCRGAWTDTQRQKIIKKIWRNPSIPRGLRGFEITKVTDLIGDVKMSAISGSALKDSYGLELSNNVFAAGTGDVTGGDGTIFSGVWTDLVESAMRLSGVYEFSHNAETNEVSVTDKYLVSYTIRPPSDGENVMATGPSGRREISGRKFQLKTFSVTSGMAMDSDLLFFIRKSDVPSDDMLMGAYLNRLENLFKPFEFQWERYENTSYYAESETLDPLVRRESNGAHFLHEYTDCVYLPTSFKSFFKSGRIDQSLLNRYLYPAGRALNSRYTFKMSVDPYYYTANTGQALNASRTQSIQTSEYKSSLLGVLDGKKNELTINLFTDDNGQLGFLRGDSYKDDATGNRLVYVQYSDSKLNSTVRSCPRIVEQDGTLVCPAELIASPVLKANVRPSRGSGASAEACNVLRNVVYAAATTYVRNTEGKAAAPKTFKPDTFMEVQVFETSVAQMMVKELVTFIDKSEGDATTGAELGFETSSTWKAIKDECNKYITSGDGSDAVSALKVIDPVLAELGNTDSAIHPIIPLTAKTDNKEKINRFLNREPFIDVAALSSINIDNITQWFKPNYAAYLSSSIKNTVEMMICYN